MLRGMGKNRRYWFAYFIIAFSICVAYWPTFTGEFILDDRPLIELNPYITEFHSLQSYLSQEDGVSPTGDKKDYHTGYYRPLIYLTYWMDYKIWGMKAPGFRTTNVILHILSCIVLFRFLLMLSNNKSLALWIALAFAVHPVNTESVSWVTSRNNILVTFFSLFTLYLFMKSQEQDKPLLIIPSVVLFGAALFSKEFGVMLLPILFLYSRLMIHERTKLSEDLIRLIPYILVFILYMILRHKTTVSFNWFLERGSKNIWEHVFFIPYLIAINLKLILLPFNLHSFIMHYPNNYFNWNTISGICIVLVTFFIVAKCKINKIISCAFLSFFIALFPILNIIPTSAVSLISMRWLYFPMAFLAPGLIALNKSLLGERKFLITSVLVVAIGYFGFYTYILNMNLWHNEKTFFQQELSRFKNTYYAYGYALYQREKNNTKKAESYFKMAITGYHHKNASVFVDYSSLLNDTGRPKEALIYLEKSRSLPKFHTLKAEWYSNMGTAYFQLENPEKALPYFKLAAAYGPNEAINWANLGAAFGALGRYEDSIKTLKKGLTLDPKSIEVMKNLVITYTRMGEYKEALDIINKMPPCEIETNQHLKNLLKNVKLKLMNLK